MECFSEKTYEKTCRFIIYFQIQVHIGHVDEVLQCGYFCEKLHDPLNLMSIFFTFPCFCEKVYEKTYQFYSFSSNFLSLCARSENFLIWNIFFLLNGGCFKMLTIYFSFPQVWPTFAIKLNKRAIVFYTYLELRLYFYNFTKFNG